MTLKIKTTPGLTDLYAKVVGSPSVAAPATEIVGCAGWYEVLDSDWVDNDLAEGEYEGAFLRGDYSVSTWNDPEEGVFSGFYFDGAASFDPLENLTGRETVAPFLLDDEQTWTFDSREQVVSPDLLVETTGQATIFKAVDFSLPLTKHGTISSIGSVTVADVSGATEPTITSAALSADKRQVYLTINASAATAATYTITVPITTVDSRTIKRFVKLQLQAQ